MTPRYPKPRILAEMPSQGHVVIEASAGTGKTYTLEHLIIELLLTTDATIDQILVVTFTEKATAELKQRIRAKLEELVTLQAGAEVPEPAWTLDAAAKQKLLNALFSLDGATVATIHSFCQRVLVENAFANQRLFQQTQIDSEEAFTDVFKECLRQEFAHKPELRGYLRTWLELVGNVEKLQKTLYDCVRERAPLLPIFDPKPFRAALVPFTKALADRAYNELKAAKVHHQTYPKVQEKLQALAEIAAGAESMTHLSLLAQVVAWTLETRDYLFEKLESDKAQKAAVSSELISHLEELAATLVPVSGVIAQTFLPFVRERLANRKRELGLFDFDDMLGLVRDSLNGARGAELASTLRGRYRFALIDEFQDTDEVQWDIFRTIFFDAGERHRLFLVGDPKQAIYRFRGADVETYFRAKKQVLKSGGTRLALTENFRSTPEVIDAYNRVFLPQGMTTYFTGEGSYEAVVCGDKTLRAEDGAGQPLSPVKLFQFAGTKMTAESVRSRLYQEIAREIQTLVDAAAPAVLIKKGGRDPVRYRDIYCLTFSSSEGIKLGQVLREAGIPIAYFKQDGLFQTREAEHIRDLLLAVEDPADKQKRLRAWLTPFFGLELTDLPKVREIPGTDPLIQRLRDWHELANERKYTRLFSRIMEESGLVRREIFWGDSERALTNYQHIFELLMEEAHRTRCTLGDLLLKLRAWIDERELPGGESGNTQRVEGERDAVQIMTMHKSKGLEAKIVFVAGGLKRSGFPSTLSICHDAARNRVAYFTPVIDPQVSGRIGVEEAQEEERLLYVTLTRAKARLYLPYVDQQSDGGDQPPAKSKGRKFEIDGVYRPAHDAVKRLLQTSDPAIPQLFERQLVVLDEAPVIDLPTPPPDDWTPPAVVPEEPKEETDHDALRERRRGFVLTSYSQLSQAHSALGDTEHDEFTEEAEVQKTLPLGENELPGGALMGVYLHELLELLPLDLTREATEFEPWRELPDVKEILTTSALRHGIEPKHAVLAEQFCFTALKTPVGLPDGSLLPSFCHTDQMLREMEFLYPIPESAHPKLGENAEGKPWTVERGFIKGFIDLLFEYNGRAYFADWKSDRPPSWDANALHEHVRDHYLVQVKLYSLALMKLLDIRTREDFEQRFGGAVYLFLRGMKIDPEGQAGIHTWRPSWDDVVAWEAELMQNETWTTPPPRRVA